MAAHLDVKLNLIKSELRIPRTKNQFTVFTAFNHLKPFAVQSNLEMLFTNLSPHTLLLGPAFGKENPKVALSPSSYLKSGISSGRHSNVFKGDPVSFFTGIRTGYGRAKIYARRQMTFIGLVIPVQVQGNGLFFVKIDFIYRATAWSFTVSSFVPRVSASMRRRKLLLPVFTSSMMLFLKSFFL